MAVHPADHRLVDIEHGIDDALGHARLVIEQVRVFGIALQVIEIAARRKGPARAGQHDKVRTRIALRKPQRLDQFVVQLKADGVHLVGTVERDLQQSAFAAHQDRVQFGQCGRGHLFSFSLAPPS